MIIRILVDFPAPFGPRNPRTSPLSTENEILSTASFGPKLLVNFSTVIMFGIWHVNQWAWLVFSGKRLKKRDAAICQGSPENYVGAQEAGGVLVGKTNANGIMWLWISFAGEKEGDKS